MSPTNSTLSWDPNRLRLVPSTTTALPASARGGRRASPIRGKFIAGPVDVSWVCQASRLGVKALLVGLALWHLKGLRRDTSFTVSNLMLQEWGIEPDAKRRALRALETASLISVELWGKRSPRVTLIAGNAGHGRMPDRYKKLV